MNPPLSPGAGVRLADLCLQFARVNRATHHPDGVRPETNADHTVMLGVYACSLAQRINDEMKDPHRLPYLDVGRVAQFALIHDLPEVYAGDVNTFGAYDVEAKRRAEDVATEASAR